MEQNDTPISEWVEAHKGRFFSPDAIAFNGDVAAICYLPETIDYIVIFASIVEITIEELEMCDEKHDALKSWNKAKDNCLKLEIPIDQLRGVVSEYLLTDTLNVGVNHTIVNMVNMV